MSNKNYEAYNLANDKLVIPPKKKKKQRRSAKRQKEIMDSLEEVRLGDYSIFNKKTKKWENYTDFSLDESDDS